MWKRAIVRNWKVGNGTNAPRTNLTKVVDCFVVDRMKSKIYYYGVRAIRTYHWFYTNGMESKNVCVYAFLCVIMSLQWKLYFLFPFQQNNCYCCVSYCPAFHIALDTIIPNKDLFDIFPHNKDVETHTHTYFFEFRHIQDIKKQTHTHMHMARETCTSAIVNKNKNRNWLF